MPSLREVPVEDSAGTAKRKACKVALGYGLAAAAYIVASSLLVGEVALDPHDHALIETLKGIGFVGVTALALGWLVHRDYRALIGAKAELAASATALARAQNAATLSVVTGAIAHDMRNLLGAAKTNLEFVEPAARGDPDASEALADVRESLGRLTEFATDLMARAGKNPSEFPAADVDLAGVARDCVRLTSLFARGHQCDIALEVESDCTVHGRRQELECAVLNLLMNAVDASDRKGRVSVSCARTNRDVLLSVRDSGPGVPLELADKIFEPFFTTKGSRGNGVGLAVTRGLVRSYGGDVRLSGPGPGAEFVLTLPASTLTPPGSSP